MINVTNFVMCKYIVSEILSTDALCYWIGGGNKEMYKDMSIS